MNSAARFGLAMLLAMVLPGFAVGDVTKQSFGSAELVQWDSPQQRDRYYRLMTELRCPKCQNQSLSDSNAPIAADLRQQLQLLMKEDYSDREILEYMQQRYGDFVLYQPPVNRVTMVLWLLPLVCLLFAGWLLLRITGVMSRAGSETAENTRREPRDV